MRILTFSICLFGLLFINSCKEIDKFTQFTMEYNSSVSIPPNTPLNLPIDLMTPEIESNAEGTFAVNDTRKDLVEEILLTNLDLDLTSPDSSDLSMLNSVEVYLNADGLSEILVAWKDNIPDNIGTTLILDITENDLKEYIKKEDFNIRVKVVTDETFSQTHQIDINTRFFVDAKVLGV